MYIHDPDVIDVILNHTELILMILDKNDDILEINSRAKDMFNLLKIEPYQSSHLTYIKDLLKPYKNELRAGKIILGTEKNIEDINTQNIAISWDFIPKFNKKTKKLDGTILIGKDITSIYNEKKLASCLNNVFEHAPGHIYIKDRQGRYIGCNIAVAKIAGKQSPQELFGKTDEEVFSHLLSKEQLEEVARTDKEVMEKGEILVKEESSDEESNITVISTKAPLRSETGKIIGIIGNSLDISDRKKMEKEILLAKEVAEVANNRLSQFMKDMNHDMRTPLVGAIGRLRQFAGDEKSQQKKESLSIIIGSLEGLLQILNTILDFNKTTEGAPKVCVSMSIKNLMTSIITLFKSAAIDKEIKLSLKIDKSIPEFLYVDNFRIKHALSNLVGNAIKFTNPGGDVSLIIKKISREENKVNLKFMVKDTGIGFPENEKSNIFEKFKKLNRSDSGKYPGTGLGLYAVKQYILELGGSIDVKSIVGKGSTFSINLSFDVPNTPMESTINGDGDKNCQQKLVLKKELRVLFIEDDITNQEVGFYELKKIGFITDLAVDVANSLVRLNTTKYDIVLSDIGLPDGTGKDIVEEVKKNNAHLNFNTMFIALTADKSIESHQEAKNSGFTEVLDKPFPLNKFSEILKKYFSSSVSEEKIVLNKKRSSRGDNKEFAAKKLRFNNKVLNWNKTINSSSLGSDQMKLVLKMKIDELPNDKIALENLKNKNDLIEGRKLIHRIKGGCAYLSADQLNAALESLDEAAKTTETLSSLNMLYQNVYQEMDKVIDEYQKLIKVKT